MLSHYLVAINERPEIKLNRVTLAQDFADSGNQRSTYPLATQSSMMEVSGKELFSRHNSLAPVNWVSSAANESLVTSQWRGKRECNFDSACVNMKQLPFGIATGNVVGIWQGSSGIRLASNRVDSSIRRMADQCAVSSSIRWYRLHCRSASTSWPPPQMMMLGKSLCAASHPRSKSTSRSLPNRLPPTLTIRQD